MSINSGLLRSFADLKQEQKEVNKRVDEMKVQVLDELQRVSLDEAVIPEVGVIVVVPKRTWKYPASVVKLEEELKNAKKDAEAKGDATYEETPFVRFDELKVN